MFPRPLTLALLLCVSSTPVFAQQNMGGAWNTVVEIPGTATERHFGQNIANVGDVDNDLHDDYLVGAPDNDTGSLYLCGYAALYSGATNTLLKEWPGLVLWERIGHSVAAAGDVDGDGRADYMLGIRHNPHVLYSDYQGRVEIYSGATNTLIRTLYGSTLGGNFGESIDAAGDVNGDGYDDVVIGSPFQSPDGLDDQWGRAQVFSGADGSVLLDWYGESRDNRFGIAVAGGGDLNGDGRPDFVVGDPYAGGFMQNKPGIVYAYSGADGSLLWTKTGPGSTAKLGEEVAIIGDVDGDGRDDACAGAPFVYDGAVYVLSGSTGAEIHQIFGLVGPYFGWVIESAGDLDFDGTPDILFGSPSVNGSTGLALVASGKTGDWLVGFPGSAAGGRFGQGVTSLRDLSLRSAYRKLVIGARDKDFGSFLKAGSVTVMEFDPFLSGPRDLWISAPDGGNRVINADFPSGEAGQNYVLLASASGQAYTGLVGVSVPLAQDWVFDLFLAGQHPASILNPTGLLDVNGDVQIDLVFPPGALSAFVGQTFSLAVLSYAPPSSTRLSTAAMRLQVY